MRTGRGAIPSAGATAAARKIAQKASKRRWASVRGSSERGCVGSELGGAGGDVGVELGLDELLEDADQFRGHHCRAAGDAHVESSVEFDDGRGAVFVGHLVVAFGAVEVGERFEASCHDAELLVGEVLGVTQQLWCDRVVLVADSGVGGEPCQLVGLGDADVAVHQCVAEFGGGVTGDRQPAQTGGFGHRAVDLGADPVADGAVSVDGVDRSAFAFAHDGGHLGGGTSTLQFQLPESFGEFAVGEVDHRVQRRFEHGSNPSKHQIEKQHENE